MRIALIVNPAASSISSRARVRIQRALADSHALEVHETSRGGHATRLAHRSAQDGCDVVLTLGGDGTINEAANGLLGSDTALAPLPGGSTNVFARALGYPNDALAATREILTVLASGRPTSETAPRCSVGTANGRLFLFHVGIGFDASVVHDVEARSQFKRYGGHPWFVYNALRRWTSEASRELTFELSTAGGNRLPGVLMAVAMNVSPYTYLGNRPLDLAPEAGPDVPLSVVATTSLDPTRLGPLAAVVAGRSTVGLPNRAPFAHWAGVHQMTVTADQPVPYQLDGEPQPPTRQLELEHLDEAIRVLVPASRSRLGPDERAN